MAGIDTLEIGAAYNTDTYGQVKILEEVLTTAGRGVVVRTAYGNEKVILVADLRDKVENTSHKPMVL